jgi:polyisoprenyl-phosphate glycosyltransferase
VKGNRVVKRATTISVVVPVYSGEAYLSSLIEQFDAVRSSWISKQAPFELSEVILVDDGAIDGSPELIDALAQNHRWLVPLHLMRNFGQHAATVAGILHSSGDWVVTMDEDLQHKPDQIETLLKQGVTTRGDVVYARPSSTVHQAKSRDWSSKGFKWLMAVMTGNPHVREFNSFRLIRGSLARGASSVCNHETYFDIALSWYTKRVSSIELSMIDERYVKTGKSGYTLRKLLSHARKLVISSQVKAIRAFGALGLLVMLISLFVFSYIILGKLFGSSFFAPDGWASLMATILFFGGFMAMTMALLLEYIATLVLAANGKPIFFTVNRSDDAALAKYFAESKA